MIYLDRFTLPIDREVELIQARMMYNAGALVYIDNIYPACLFSKKDLRELNFDDVTILYGGNGSGKSTLLNLIATKMGLERLAPYNGSELFPSYADACEFFMASDDDGNEYGIPEGSRMITSDDVFDYMLAVRSNNQEIAEAIEDARDDYTRLKCGPTIRFSGMEDYEEHRAQVLARKKTRSRRTYIREAAGVESTLRSNGETALEYFDTRLKAGTLYCLDEPENSLSPRLQLKLVEILREVVHSGTQLIIATHSPFLLSMSGARIYDLDASPVDIKNWWELENTRTYYEFFKENAELFENK